MSKVMKKDSGAQVVMTAPTGGVASGGFVNLGSLMGFAGDKRDAGKRTPVSVEGIAYLSKEDVAILEGAPVYWDDTRDAVSPDNGIFFGFCAEFGGATASSTKCRVRLAPPSGPTLYFAAKFERAGSDLAIGTHLFGPTLPFDAIIKNAWYAVGTTFTSAGDTATIKLGIDTEDDDALKAATAINAAGNHWDQGFHAVTPDGTPGNYTSSITNSAGRQLVATVATQAITAGKLVVHGEFCVI